MIRPSRHVEPTSSLEYARHYIRELVYGANDGVITTFAVVAGVAGGGISSVAVLIVGTANLLADGLSMAVGNYLSIRSNESALRAQGLPEEEAQPVRHAVATFIAFVVAGAVPLLPYVMPQLARAPFALSIVLTLIVLFAIGALRARATADRAWASGLETLGLGVVVAVVAYGAGAAVASAVEAATTP
jgi:VIT1/CCC1 family predicted Fe2+/Mn2+ transporter